MAKKLYTLQVADATWVSVIDFYEEQMLAIKEAAVRLMNLAAYRAELRIIDNEQEPIWLWPAEQDGV